LSYKNWDKKPAFEVKIYLKNPQFPTKMKNQPSPPTLPIKQTPKVSF
jgi:hypothetical protein